MPETSISTRIYCTQLRNSYQAWYICGPVEPEIRYFPAAREVVAKVSIMHRITRLCVGGAVTLLAGCGTTEPGRVQGAATTRATVGIVGGPAGVVTGGVIGGRAAAVAGADISAKEGNLGEPAWNKR